MNQPSYPNGIPIPTSRPSTRSQTNRTMKKNDDPRARAPNTYTPNTMPATPSVSNDDYMKYLDTNFDAPLPWSATGQRPMSNSKNRPAERTADQNERLPQQYNNSNVEFRSFHQDAYGIPNPSLQRRYSLSNNDDLRAHEGTNITGVKQECFPKRPEMRSQGTQVVSNTAGPCVGNLTVNELVAALDASRKARDQEIKNECKQQMHDDFVQLKDDIPQVKEASTLKRSNAKLKDCGDKFKVTIQTQKKAYKEQGDQLRDAVEERDAALEEAQEIQNVHESTLDKFKKYRDETRVRIDGLQKKFTRARETERRSC